MLVFKSGQYIFPGYAATSRLGYIVIRRTVRSRVTSGRLVGVVVSVLDTGPKGYGFEPGQGDGFLRAIKIRSTPSSWMGSKAGRSHVVRFHGV
jgi:hypothetical protein